jgi:hypothetical protein
MTGAKCCSVAPTTERSASGIPYPVSLNVNVFRPLAGDLNVAMTDFEPNPAG